ncbi:methyl-accepting chemotaxis protein [Herbaspirillum sp. RV1423]|uniref:methyl-accepting chemotaxis protein n=1 Tax=Herbaspirillum sp. RV1423 TaxID=1443993 RepID=UPI0004BB12FB|nr:methyl-accepting chemotaxis protein [Herbaspirillum sp. RV1423]
MKFSSLRIGHRLSLCFGVILVLMAAVTALAGLSAHRAQQRLAAALSHTNGKSEIAALMRQSLFRQGQAARNVGTLTDLNAMQKEMARIGSERKNYRVNQAALLKAGVSVEEQAIVNEMEGYDRRSEPFIRQAEEFAAGFNAGQATKLLNTEVAPLQSQWLEAIDKLVKLEQSQIQSDLDDFAASSRQTTLATIAICAVAMLLAALVASRLNRSITRPLNEAVSLASRVAAGDLTAHIAGGGKDETGQLLAALGSMNQSLLQTVSEVRNGTQSIFRVSQQNAAGNTDLAARTEAQAGSLQQTAGAMAELTDIVGRNARQIGEANRLAQSAAGVASRGGEIVSSVVGTMSAIKDSSRKVVDIIAVIDGIAFQTNILALNAAVEAARAGELGRGFAVVATEVRQLAMRSAAAAKEIKVLIGDSVERIDAGSRQVDDAGQTMREIVGSVEHVVGIMDEIAAASDAQNHGIADLNQSIAEIDAVTRTNAMLVAQAATATADMQEQARKLWSAVSAFRVGEQHDGLADLHDIRSLPPTGKAGLPQRETPMISIVPA